MLKYTGIGLPLDSILASAAFTHSTIVNVSLPFRMCVRERRLDSSYSVHV